MNTRTTLTSLLVFAVFLSGCVRAVERIVVEPLSEDEMAIPAGRYQTRTDMWNTGRVRMLSPQAAPVLKWRIELPTYLDWTTVYADSEGGAWYGTGRMIHRWDRIVRLHPDGSVDWQRMMPHDSTSTVSRSEPVVVLEGAVACMQFTSVKDPNNPTARRSGEPHTFLECIDLEGKTRWRSEVLPTRMGQHGAWRISENRIAMVTENYTWSIFSLKDGELLSTLGTPGWLTLLHIGPMPLPNGDFLTFGGYALAPGEGLTYVARLALDGSIVWINKFSARYMFSPSLSDDGVLAVTTRHELRGIDIESGDVIWKRDCDPTEFVIGATYEGNFLLAVPSSEGPALKLIDPSGEDIWRIDLPQPGIDFDAEPIVFEDNSIMVGHETGFFLINADGTIRWEVDSADLGYDGLGDFDHWMFNPGPDGLLVVRVMDKTEGWSISERKELILGFVAE